MTDQPTEQKILRFIKLCRVTDGLTIREIAGGTQLPIADVRKALDSLVASGTLTSTGEPEMEFQRRRYNTPTVAEVVAPKPEPYESADQRINRESRAAYEADKLAHQPPAPPTVHYPTDAEVQTILDAKEAERKSIVFTPEERAQLKLMDGRLTGLNPNVAIVNPKR